MHRVNEARAVKMSQRTIENPVYRGKGEGEAEELDDYKRDRRKVTRILDLLFIYAASSLSWALLWCWED